MKSTLRVFPGIVKLVLFFGADTFYACGLWTVVFW